MLWNITTVVGIIYRGKGWECEIKAYFISINIFIGTKLCCGGETQYKREIAGEDMIKVIRWLLAKILVIFVLQVNAHFN